MDYRAIVTTEEAYFQKCTQCVTVQLTIDNCQLTIDNSPMLQKLSFLLLLLALSALPLQAQTDPAATPDADGRIYIIVQPGDTLWAVVDRAGISMDEMLALNNMAIDDLLQPGDKLLIGIIAPTITPTPPASPTATLPPPTAVFTPIPPPTSICVLAFVDEDGNGVHNTGEPLRTAVAFTIFNESRVIGNHVTDGISEPFCWENLEVGEYKITRSIGKNEVLTTAGDWTLSLKSGDELDLLFGSRTVVAGMATITRPALQPSVPTLFPSSPTPQPPSENGGGFHVFNLLWMLPVLMIVGAMGLLTAVAIWLIRDKNKTR